MAKYNVSVKLTGRDRNAFSIIGAVSIALTRAGLKLEAKAFREKAFACESYDALLRLAMDTVNVS